ncbi:MAG: protein kinase [Acidobacteriota bacterium]|nr:MAG: protein kinase [Acidobacteriota bacterium]
MAQESRTAEGGLQAGDRIGRYTIVERIGKGGMGEVFLAEDTRLDRKVALKTLPPQCCEDSEGLARFVREAKAASALNHPNIITIYEIDETGDVTYIASEYIEGVLLQDKVSEGELTAQEVLDIASQIASALTVAHSAGIVHRDIKPANVMIRRDGLVKVLDFGIAKLVATEEPEIDPEAVTKPHLTTREGLVLGTVGYMSPEQARGRNLDARSDIWSLGCVLYEMIAGRKAFEGETIADVLAGIIHKEPEPLAAFGSNVHPEFERIVGRALCKVAEDRYRSAEEMLEDLNRLKTRLLLEEAETGRFAAYVSAETASEPESIAVLPFADISASEDTRYFSEGLTEEIIMNLSKLKQLRVISRSATRQYVQEGKTHRDMADDLGVQYLLEGGVRCIGNEIRITAQLIDAYNQVYLWAESYRGTIDDVFEIQENVAAEIVRALKVRLSTDEQTELRKRYTENTEAYQMYLRGRFFWNKRSEEGIRNAIRYFEMAIEEDPEYALAWAGIADSYTVLGEYGSVPRRQLFPKARAAVEKALEFDSSLAEAHCSNAILMMLEDWDWEGSAKEFELAIELNPSYATAYQWYSQWFESKGETEEAIRYATKAAELDPVSQAIQQDLGLALYYDRRYEEAIEVALRTLELDPVYPAAHRLLSLAYQAVGRFEEAIEENERWGELTGNEIETDVSRAQLLAASGKPVEARSILERVPAPSGKSGNLFRGLALAFAAIGEKEKALECLEEGLDRREEALLSIKVDPKLDILRNEPRFIGIIRAMGL